jgi:hypothetical protein
MQRLRILRFGFDDTGPVGHARVIAHAPEQRGDARVATHAAIGEMLLIGQHQRGVEKFRIATAIAQQPREHIELPFASRGIEK